MPAANTDDEALLVLAAAGGGVPARRRLLETHGSPLAALGAGARDWRSHALDDAQVRALSQPDQSALGRVRAWLASSDHHVIGWHDPDYPALLRRIASPPLVLFVAGDPGCLWHPSVAVVGTRSPTAGGRDNARDFAHALAVSGLGVVSGLAAGVDTEAHSGALAADGRTVAVLGTGPDVPYPRANTPCTHASSSPAQWSA